jgi:aspartate 1-decarboxylase
MQIEVMCAKIHRATITDAHLHYVGSIGIDGALIEAAGLVEGQRVQIVNVNNGERLETYIIREEKDSGRISLNGPAARRVQVGDVIIIIAYAFCTLEEARNLEPRVLFPNAQNRLAEVPQA